MQFGERLGVLPTEAEVQNDVRAHLPVILDEGSAIPTQVGDWGIAVDAGRPHLVEQKIRNA